MTRRQARRTHDDVRDEETEEVLVRAFFLDLSGVTQIDKRREGVVGDDGVVPAEKLECPNGTPGLTLGVLDRSARRKARGVEEGTPVGRGLNRVAEEVAEGNLADLRVGVPEERDCWSRSDESEKPGT